MLQNLLTKTKRHCTHLAMINHFGPLMTFLKTKTEYLSKRKKTQAMWISKRFMISLAKKLCRMLYRATTAVSLLMDKQALEKATVFLAMKTTKE